MKRQELSLDLVRLRGWLVRAVLAILALFAISVSTELVLEAHDAAGLPTDSEFCTVDGHRVRYRLVGADKASPTIVLVTGGMGSLEQWYAVQNALATEAPVLSYDRAGMGFSEEPSGHDAFAESDELAGLLQNSALKPPFVVVSYSLSSLMARALAGRRPDLVAGLVFLDPMVPEANTALPANRRITYARMFGSGVVKRTLEAFIGYLRLRQFLRDLRNPPKTVVEANENKVLESFHHWRATTEDIMALDRSVAEVMAMPPVHGVPIGVLSAVDRSESERLRLTFEGQRSLAESDPHGEFRSIKGIDHLKLLSGGAESKPAIDMILDIERRARSSAGESSP